MQRSSPIVCQDPFIFLYILHPYKALHPLRVKTLEETQLSSTAIASTFGDRNNPVESRRLVGFRLTSASRLFSSRMDARKWTGERGRQFVGGFFRTWRVSVFNSNYEEQNEQQLGSRRDRPKRFEAGEFPIVTSGRRVRGCCESRPTINSTRRPRF